MPSAGLRHHVPSGSVVPGSVANLNPKPPQARACPALCSLQLWRVVWTALGGPGHTTVEGYTHPHAAAPGLSAAQPLECSQTCPAPPCPAPRTKASPAQSCPALSCPAQTSTNQLQRLQAMLSPGSSGSLPFITPGPPSQDSMTTTDWAAQLRSPPKRHAALNRGAAFADSQALDGFSISGSQVASGDVHADGLTPHPSQLHLQPTRLASLPEGLPSPSGQEQLQAGPLQRSLTPQQPQQQQDQDGEQWGRQQPLAPLQRRPPQQQQQRPMSPLSPKPRQQSPLSIKPLQQPPPPQQQQQQQTCMAPVKRSPAFHIDQQQQRQPLEEPGAPRPVQPPPPASKASSPAACGGSGTEADSPERPQGLAAAPVPSQSLASGSDASAGLAAVQSGQSPFSFAAPPSSSDDEAEHEDA